MMKVMILAAGRGERMRPLTDHTPKPLLQVAGKAIIEHTLLQLVKAGFTEIVINHAYLGQQIEEYLGQGDRYGVHIYYSSEGELGLETAGGIIHALPLLGDEPFLVVNGDIATDFPFELLPHQSIDLAHLVLVDNPSHHTGGDFGLDANGQVTLTSDETFTFSGIGVYNPDLFKDRPQGPCKLGDVIRQGIRQKRISGQKVKGFWMDIGTPERLDQLHKYYTQQLI